MKPEKVLQFIGRLLGYAIITAALFGIGGLLLIVIRWFVGLL
jgi:hypothetical protein